MKYLDIKDVQQYELEVLSTFDSLCRNNNIHYSLSGGTLLGAIRHKGFIPWDDDVDVLMTRDEYNKFIKVCETQLPKNYFLQTYKTDSEYPISFAKLRNVKYHITVPELIDLNIKSGACIDIFPIDKAYDNFILDYMQRILISVLDILKLSSLKEKNASSLKIKIKNIISIFGRILKIKNICILDEKIRSSCPKNNRFTYADFMPPAYKLKRNQRFEWNIFENYCEVDFEDRKFMVIKDYHIYLTRWYGNYMELPPKEKRMPDHNFILVEKNV